MTTVYDNCVFHTDEANGIIMDSTSSSTISAYTPSGTWVKVKHEKDKQGKISPQLFIKYVKSKLSVLETEKHQRQIDKLTKLIMKTDIIGQHGLSERLAKQLAICVRELEAKACGINKSIPRDVVNKYIDNVKDVRVIMCELENYPRIIPNDVHALLETIVAKGLFDKYLILYLDYSDGKDEDSVPVKTTKQKVIEKDPIIFSYYEYQPDKLYFILDYVDDFCDLTFDKLLDKVMKDDPEFTVEMIPVVSKKTVDAIVQSVIDQHNRLDITRPSNYKELAQQEEEATQSRMKGWFNDSIFNKIKDWFK